MGSTTKEKSISFRFQDLTVEQLTVVKNILYKNLELAFELQNLFDEFDAPALIYILYLKILQGRLDCLEDEKQGPDLQKLLSAEIKFNMYKKYESFCKQMGIDPMVKLEAQSGRIADILHFESKQ